MNTENILLLLYSLRIPICKNMIIVQALCLLVSSTLFSVAVPLELRKKQVCYLRIELYSFPLFQSNLSVSGVSNNEQIYL